MKFRTYNTSFSAAEREDLVLRLTHTRWPDQLSDDWSKGMPLAAARSYAKRWAAADFDAMEALLNSFDQLTTHIHGQRFHLLHARSAASDATPLLVAHGYPSSFVEFLPVVTALTERFHVVIPSIPGFGFSTPMRSNMWGMPQLGNAFDAIMVALGYDRYGMLAGDVGAGVATEIGILAGDRLIGTIFTTDPGAVATPYTPPTDHLDDAEHLKLEEIRRARLGDFGYLSIQQTRPHSVSYGLSDSPIMQLIWIVEKLFEWRGPNEVDFADNVDPDLVLALASVAWFGGGGAGAAELLWTVAHSTASWGQSGNQPVGYAAFGDEALQRRVLDPESKLFWREHPRGGHFPALEVPELLVADVDEFFATLMA